MLKKIRQYFTNPINKKAASITALALTALAIPLTVFISQQQQELRQRAQEVTTKGGGDYVSLTLAPSILEKAPGETFDVELYFEAKTYSITGVDVTINYDPSILQIERFTPVSTFNNVLINKHISDNIKGEYRYAAVDTVNAPQTGRITVGIITFKTQNTTGTSYVDLNNIQITALNQPSDAIPTANNTQGKYAVAIPTPTPTTAPTETPIPATPEPIGSCATLYNRIIKTFGNSCGNASYDKVADLNKDKRISSVDYSKFLTYSNNATTCENALNDPTDPCTTPGTTTAPAQSTPTSTPAASPIPTPIAAIIGDANGDATADILDFNIWRDEFLLTFGKPTILRADFNKDGRVDLLDFSIWRNVISNPNPRSPTSAPSPTATPTPIAQTYKKVFVTSTNYDGNLGDASGADQKCQTRANTANLGGTWKAWLSNNRESASSRLNQSTVPYKRLDGIVVANDWNDLIDGSLKNPINITELGTVKSSLIEVWTNTGNNGVIDTTDINKNCYSWNNGSASFQGVQGRIDITAWSDSSITSCSTLNALYCFEQ